MRIIGGLAKGRVLHFPSKSKERPTSDFLREALFNLLGPLDGKTFLDLFAGSGSAGLEAASRGAKEVYLVEKNKELIEIIKKNVQKCCFDATCRVITGDIDYSLSDLFRKKYKFDIVFADPPYNRGLVEETLKILTKYPVLRENGIITIQHSIKETFGDYESDHIYQVDQRKYGDNALTFFNWRKNDE